MISKQQISKFESDGYIHIPNFFDENGIEKTEEFSDIYSRCFQHEFDHLDGVCFNQRVSRIVFEMAKKKRRKLHVRQE